MPVLKTTTDGPIAIAMLRRPGKLSSMRCRQNSEVSCVNRSSRGQLAHRHSSPRSEVTGSEVLVTQAPEPGRRTIISDALDEGRGA